MSTAVPAVADVTAEPTVRAFPPGWDRKPQRVIDYRWPVAHDAGGEVIVELGCYHDGDRKVYRATVRNHRVSDGMMSTILHESALVLRESCPRYGKPKFEAFAQGALAHFRELVAAGRFEQFTTGATAPGPR